MGSWFPEVVGVVRTASPPVSPGPHASHLALPWCGGAVAGELSKLSLESQFSVMSFSEGCALRGL